MRVLKVTHVLYLSEVDGRLPLSGAERHVMTLLRGLSEVGVDVELVAMLWSGERYALVEHELADLERSGVKVTRLRRKSAATAVGRRARILQAWTALLRILSCRRNRIVHIHLDLVWTLSVACLAGCHPIVASIHNDEPCYQRLRWRLWFRLIDRRVAKYVAITNHVRDYFSDATGVSAAKVSTVYYGVPPVEDLQDRQKLRTRFGLGINDVVIGYVGRLTEQKNLSVFIDAMRCHPHMTAVIVGGGELHRALLRQVASNRMRNVRLLGPVPNASTLMPMFDVLCLPSLWEGLGLVLIEAMQYRVPIVASNRGAIPEILGHGRYGFLAETTVESLAKAIGDVAADPRKAAEIADLAHRHAAATFAVPRMVAATRLVYGEFPA